MKKLLLAFLISGIIFPAFSQSTPKQIDACKGLARGQNSYSVSIPCPNFPSTPYSMGKISVTYTITNTGASTLRVNNQTAVAITLNGSALSAGDIPANTPLLMMFDSISSKWSLSKPAPSTGVSTVTVTAGSNISVTSGTNSYTVTNTAPNQTVTLTGAGSATVSGTYPTYTVTTPSASLTNSVTPIASGTAGSVLVHGAGDKLMEFNSKFFWDQANSRLGIGVSTPANSLNINGAQTYGAHSLYVQANTSNDGISISGTGVTEAARLGTSQATNRGFLTLFNAGSLMIDQNVNDASSAYIKIYGNGGVIMPITLSTLNGVSIFTDVLATDRSCAFLSDKRMPGGLDANKNMMFARATDAGANRVYGSIDADGAGAFRIAAMTAGGGNSFPMILGVDGKADAVSISGTAASLGFVGINQVVPTSRLSITTAAATSFMDATDGTVTMQSDLSNGGNGVGLNFGTTSAHPLYFFTNGSGSSKMTIESGGDIGIGITNPTRLLQVNGTFYSSVTETDTPMDETKAVVLTPGEYCDIQQNTSHAMTFNVYASNSNLQVANMNQSGVFVFDRSVTQKQGTDVASSSTITITYTGNAFELTGTTAVDFITTTGWQEGSEITLIANENVTINDDAGGGNIRLAGNANFSMTADDILTIVYSSTTAGGAIWREKARSAN